MQIAIQTISAKRGLQVSDTLPVGPLNGRMNEAPDNDITFLSDIRINLDIKKQIQGALIEGTASTSYRQDCGRCGDPIEQPLSVTIKLELKRREGHHGEDYEDDVGIMTFEGEHIEIDDIIHEHLILSLSPVLQPPCSENGGCLICSKLPTDATAEKSGTVMLGDLLKDVKIKKRK